MITLLSEHLDENDMVDDKTKQTGLKKTLKYLATKRDF